MSEAAFEARNVKWRIALMLAGCLLVILASAWVAGLLGTPPRPGREWLGWIGLTFFLFCGALAVRRLFDNDVQLRISEQGLLWKRWSDKTIPWSAISDVGMWSHRGLKSVTVTLVDRAAYPSTSPLALLGKADRNITGADIVISLVGTDSNFDRAMAAVQRFRPR